MTEEVKGQSLGKAQLTPSETQEESQSQAQPEYVTVEVAKQMVDQAVQQAESKAQSLVDKSGNRLQARVQEKLQALEATLKLQADAGVEVTPEQRERLQQQVMVEAFKEEAEEKEPAASAGEPGDAQPPGGQAGQIDPITQAAWSMMEERGVEILDTDPEFKMVDTSSPYKFLLSVDKAITTKETRLQSSSEEPETKTGSPQARIPGAGAGGSTGTLLPEGTPPIERLDSFFKKQ